MEPLANLTALARQRLARCATVEHSPTQRDVEGGRVLMLNRVARLLRPGARFLELRPLVAETRTVTAVQVERVDRSSWDRLCSGSRRLPAGQRRR